VDLKNVAVASNRIEVKASVIYFYDY
jgi:hypothetical protein